MANPRSRRKRAEKVMKQMPLDMWIDFEYLLLDSGLTHAQLGAFLTEARKRGFVKRKLKVDAILKRYTPVWKRVAPVVNF